MRLDSTSAQTLIAIPATLAIGLVSPQVAAAVFFGALVWLAVRRKAFFHPAIFVGAGTTLFLLIGGLNVSYYCGIIQDEFFFYVLQAIMAFSAGAALVTLVTRAPDKRPLKITPVSIELVILSALPGVVGVLWVVLAVGIPLINPEARFLAPGRAMLLAETLNASFVLLAYYYLSRGVPKPTLLMVAFGGIVMFLLLVPGYRNWPLVACLIAMIGLTLSGGMQINVRKLALFGGIAVFLLAIIMEFRRDNSSSLVDTATTMEIYRVEYIPAFLAQVHFGFRESLGIGQWLLQTGSTYTGPPLFIADILTMFGSELTGGRIIAERVGAALDGGLTAGLVGVLTLEFGATTCLLMFFCAGMFGSVLWNWFRRNMRPEIAFVYGYFLVNFLLLFHRGIPKPSNFIVPAYFYALVMMSGVIRSMIRPAAPPLRRRQFGGRQPLPRS